jgi:hypothetical protein
MPVSDAFDTPSLYHPALDPPVSAGLQVAFLLSKIRRRLSFISIIDRPWLPAQQQENDCY